MANATPHPTAPPVVEEKKDGKASEKPPVRAPGEPLYMKDAEPPASKKAKEAYEKKKAEEDKKTATHKPPPPFMGQVQASPGDQRSIYENQPGQQLPGFPEHEGYAKDQQHLRGSYIKDGAAG